ncbi:carbohydrate ABC transporter permease [Rhizobium leguminosarum]|uniref:carbohydrate ABC transporter permease n=1 Tax=Rhizobium leguminosarum TaxID=384 RepID=UPI001031CFCE|nr:carbohydrate ABC transporter permease [Rhizobium leguminosarum]TAU73816.1 carbohydrate ABC transporter permease [Rhizobium leguminosarum]TAX03374.1 carbohydrate ABC transporter permease [Rhizobium leguminosarum]TAX23991.1 carbohydrate ABC transporter permease [Rhizobium leguminosarum]TAY05678.1 carbohydrate ABC transporter permease [Rhizobium leguminosarum]TAZ03577.1 carbohydrate ABC transporter permease [Rhizobium leguminosarum]
MERLNHSLAAKPASERLGYLAFVLTACVFAIFFVMPIVWSFANSFKPAAAALADPAALFSKAFSLENYRRLEHVGAGWYVYAGNSVLIAAGTVILTVLVSVPAGYGFSKFRFPGQSLLFVLIMATMMIPFQSILTPLFLILKFFHLQNSLLGLVLIYVTFQLPFSVFMMRNAFDAVPKALIEAARIDGASQATILRRIMLPIALPGVATVAMFAFLNSWNEFLAALIFLSDQNKFTLPIMLVNVSSGIYGIIDWGALQAGIAVTMVPCILLFLLLQRYYVRGLTAGAVK